MPGPLDGIRVLELGTAVQGPSAGQLLSDLGAEVVRVEPPQGEVNRYFRGVGNSTAPETPGTQFLTTNRGKRFVILDATTERGKDAILRLMKRSDVFLSNYRQAALEKLGLDYEAARAANEGIVYGHVNGFGQFGPDAAKPMIDGAAPARGGVGSVPGEPDGPPPWPGAMLADYAGGMQLTLGILGALVARPQPGRGQRVETSALGAQLWLQSWEICHASVTGYIPQRSGAHSPMTPNGYGVYETADGRFLLSAYFHTEEAWTAFCEYADMPDLATDPRFDSVAKRLGVGPDGEAAAALRPYLCDAYARHTFDEWQAFFEPLKDAVIQEGIRSYADVLEDPQNLANDHLLECEIPGVGPRKLVGPCIWMSDTTVEPGTSFPSLGEHTDEVLAELGFDESERAAIRSATHAAREKLGLPPDASAR